MIYEKKRTFFIIIINMETAVDTGRPKRKRKEPKSREDISTGGGGGVIQQDHQDPVVVTVPEASRTDTVTTVGGGEQETDGVIRRTSQRPSKKPRKDLSPPPPPLTMTNNRIKDKPKGQEKSPENMPRKSTVRRQRLKEYGFWSPEDKDIFFEGLYEFGKDFDAIQKHFGVRYKRKGAPLALAKNKDQIRYFYYRTWHKVENCKAVKLKKGYKKSALEVFCIINYATLRKKICENPLNKRNGQKLNELINTGSTVVRVKGKNIRIKTPLCRALEGIGKRNGSEKPQPVKLPSNVLFEICPRTNSAFLRVQNIAQNPYIRMVMPLRASMRQVISFLERKWTLHSRTLLHVAKNPLVEKPDYTLHLYPLTDANITPVYNSEKLAARSQQVHLDDIARSPVCSLNNAPTGCSNAASVADYSPGSGINVCKTKDSDWSQIIEVPLSPEQLSNSKILQGVCVDESGVDVTTSPRNKCSPDEELESFNDKSILCDEINEEYFEDGVDPVTDIETDEHPSTLSQQSSNNNETVSTEMESWFDINGRGVYLFTLAPNNVQQIRTLGSDCPDSDLERQRVFEGWKLSTVGSLTVAELYVVFGCSKKISLEYDWDVSVSDCSTTPSSTAEGFLGVTSPIQQLLRLAAMEYKTAATEKVSVGVNTDSSNKQCPDCSTTKKPRAKKRIPSDPAQKSRPRGSNNRSPVLNTTQPILNPNIFLNGAMPPLDPQLPMATRTVLTSSEPILTPPKITMAQIIQDRTFVMPTIIPHHIHRRELNHIDLNLNRSIGHPIILNHGTGNLIPYPLNNNNGLSSTINISQIGSQINRCTPIHCVPVRPKQYVPSWKRKLNPNDKVKILQPKTNILNKQQQRHMNTVPSKPPVGVTEMVSSVTQTQRPLLLPSPSILMPTPTQPTKLLGVPLCTDRSSSLQSSDLTNTTNHIINTINPSYTVGTSSSVLHTPQHLHVEENPNDMVPFPFDSPLRELHWLERPQNHSEVSLASLLCGDSPDKRGSPEIPTTVRSLSLQHEIQGVVIEDSHDSFITKHSLDVDATLQCMMNESSLDYISKFADLAAQISCSQSSDIDLGSGAKVVAAEQTVSST